VDRALEDGAGGGRGHALSLSSRLARAALALALCAACGAKDPVQGLLDGLEKAAEARDAERFGAHLSPTFKGAEGYDRAGAIAALRRYFAAYESVSLSVYGVETQRTAAGAQVKCVAEFSGRGRTLGGLDGLLPPGATYRFELTLADQDGTWRVTSAEWTPVTLDPSAAPSTG
jgi:hypothetical protein